MPYYSAHLHLSAATLAIMLAFAILIAGLGLALDAISLSVWRRRTNVRSSRVVGLPFIPAMLYLFSSFIWLLRGNSLLAVAQFVVFASGHALLHVSIARSRTSNGRR